MPRKKVTKNTSSRKTSRRVVSHRTDNSHFVIIVAGGALLILLMSVFFIFPSISKNVISKTDKSSSEQYVKNIILIGESGFQPDTITVKTGDIVTWKNSQDQDHVIIIKENNERLERLYKGGVTSYKFTEPGTYSYYSGDTPTLTGKVIVR